ncbi:alginate O-acetyltransferase AlgF [Bradyrhizobium sp.]|uniref:alginate O-acetyltransferase AlgF n=1 Tax=Bradyrhizobium sp. TaxID=376 RepID=UPI0009FC37FD|nr:alginate O-acetyltransferase AlgF [Bradyrhizobium sp.]
MAPLLPCDRLSRRLFGFAVLLLALSIVRPGQSPGQEIGRLYATRPPPGYAFVRIVMASDGHVPRIQVDFLDLLMSEATGASSYRAVPGNQPLNLSIDGSAVSKDIVPGAGRYLTLVISKTNSDWTLQSIDEAQSSSDGLKARLRFFNLVPGCTAMLKIADGPTIFEQTSFASVRSRTINPVIAKLEGSCGEGNALLTLPQLRTGDYYSLFLRKGSGRLRLTGQLDEIEAYRER